MNQLRKNAVDYTERGVKSVGVPGVIKGLYELHHGRGLLPWRKLFAEAIRIAQSGYLADPHLKNSISTLEKFSDKIESPFKKYILKKIQNIRTENLQLH